MPLAAVVFDFDGVIADTEPLHFRALREVLAEEGIRLDEVDYYRRYVGLEDTDGLMAIARDRDRSLDQDMLADLLSRKAAVMARLLTNVPLFPGAAACVRALSAEVPLAIASGAIRSEIELVLETVGLRERFAHIVASGETAQPKPAPDPYLRAVSLLGVQARTCVAVEDSKWGLEAASAAGLRTVAVTHTLAAEELRNADMMIESLNEATLARLGSLIDLNAG